MNKGRGDVVAEGGFGEGVLERFVACEECAGYRARLGLALAWRGHGRSGLLASSGVLTRGYGG